jgi:ribonuclease D
VQVATSNRLAVIDPLEGGDVDPIARLVADRTVELLMHAPSGDLVLFARRFGVVPSRVFDVQLIAGFVGLGSSLAYDRLVEHVLRVRLEHNETFSNWSVRPLSPTQIAYAADDVRHLHALADALARDIDRRGRTAYAADELARRYGSEDVGAPDPRRAYLKLPRRGRLTARQLAVLREVAAWREEEARTRDLPVGWVLKDPAALEIARTMPRDAAAIAAGIDAEPMATPREPSSDVVRRVATALDLAAVLLRVRCDEAELAPELVATRGELERFVMGIVTGDVGGQPLAAGWRDTLVGAELRQLVGGRVAIAVRATAPYVEIIPA